MPSRQKVVADSMLWVTTGAIQLLPLAVGDPSSYGSIKRSPHLRAPNSSLRHLGGGALLLDPLLL